MILPYFPPLTETVDGSNGSKPTRLRNEAVASLVGSEFWEALSVEAQGLRETLEDSDDKDADAVALPPEDVTHSTPGIFKTNAILFSLLANKFDTLQITPGLREALLELYGSRVDTVYKILHWPTTLRSIQTRYRSDDAPVSLSSQVLETAIYFMATCSLMDEESKDGGFGDKSRLLHAFRSSAEYLFAQSGVLQSPDLVLLQAFVIYLVRTKSPWMRGAKH
jgi:hypothetical protein